jgi:hypothetical protein
MSKQAPQQRRRGAAAKARAAATAVLLATLGLAALAQASSSGPGHVGLLADAARTLNATDTGDLHFIPPAHGSEVYEEGTARGTLPGSMRAHCKIGAVVEANFTIYTRGGTITGHGKATPNGSGEYESFAGSILVTSGTGRYAHAHGRAGLYGTFNRKTYALVVQTTGQLSY